MVFGVIFAREKKSNSKLDNFTFSLHLHTDLVTSYACRLASAETLRNAC
jgi:hypothetical protein